MALKTAAVSWEGEIHLDWFSMHVQWPACLKFQILMSTCAQFNSSLDLKGLAWGSCRSVWNSATLSADFSRERKQRLLPQIILWEINPESLLLERRKCHYPKHIPILKLQLSHVCVFYVLYQPRTTSNECTARIDICMPFSFNLDFDHGYVWVN